MKNIILIILFLLSGFTWSSVACNPSASDEVWEEKTTAFAQDRTTMFNLMFRRKVGNTFHAGHNIQLKDCQDYGPHGEFTLMNDIENAINYGFHYINHYSNEAFTTYAKDPEALERAQIFLATAKKIMGNFLRTAREPFIFQCRYPRTSFLDYNNFITNEDSLAVARTCYRDINNFLGMELNLNYFNRINEVQRAKAIFHELLHHGGWQHSNNPIETVSIDWVYRWADCAFSNHFQNINRLPLVYENNLACTGDYNIFTFDHAGPIRHLN